MSPAWKKYQEEARNFFSSLGLEARTDVKIQGVRASHAVDVFITFTRFGIQHRWIVECKLWRTSIPKEKVLALQSVLLDVGADKGFLLSETGFQAGALRAASATNILLTSLEVLRSEAQDELRVISLDGQLRALDDTLGNLRSMPWRQEYRAGDRAGGLICHAPPGYFETVGRLSIIEQSLRAARRGALPVLLDLDDEDQPRSTSDISELLHYSEALLARVNDYIRAHKDFRATRDGAS